MADSNYVFLPYVRLGLGARNSVVDDPTIADQIGSLTIPATVTVGGASGDPPVVNLTLRGPADVYTIASSQIVRTEPVQGATAFETNYFPFIEFARADFPWLFTPAKANTDNRLRPWIVLIVVEASAVTYTAPSSGPAFLTDVPAEQLPDLSESAYWAFAQVSGSLGTSSLSSVITDEPERVVSRLVCPRRLNAFTNYRACLVPAFASALGQTEDAASLEPAWDKDSTPKGGSLPVFYSWTFSTGDQGDFESLVRQLQPLVMPATVGVRALDASDAGLGLPAADTTSLSYVGVLKAPAANPGSWPEESPNSFQDTLAEKLNKAGDFIADDEEDPVIAPPIYGRWHAAQDQVAVNMDPQWLADLNLDPRVRVVAAMATEVIKAQQESLMASAWDQYDGIKELNNALCKAQCAREVSMSLKTRHIDTADNDVKTQLLSPAHSRVLNSGLTVKATLRATSLPKGTATAAFRRATRAGGYGARVARLNNGSSSTTSLKVLGLFDKDCLGERFPDSDSPVTSLLGADLPNPDGMYRTTDVPEAESSDLARFDKDLRSSEADAMDLDEIGLAFEKGIDPAAAILARMQSRSSYALEDLDPILAAPNFPSAMYSYLRDVAGDWFVPGLENVLDNSVTLLETNPPAIEAYMVGLSHEMGRELLWREFPTDQRGTYFKQFWDPASNYSASSKDTDTSDIGPIHLWKNALGEHIITGLDATTGTTPPLLVLLIRGELLRRYPDTIVYALANSSTDINQVAAQDGLYPLFDGTLGTDIYFFGLPLTQEEAQGDPGYYIVLQQHPTAPRFGLDETSDGSNPSWEDEDVKIINSHLSVANLKRGVNNSADMGSLTFQLPFRILIHASDMLPPKS